MCPDKTNDFRYTVLRMQGSAGIALCTGYVSNKTFFGIALIDDYRATLQVKTGQSGIRRFADDASMKTARGLV